MKASQSEQEIIQEQQIAAEDKANGAVEVDNDVNANPVNEAGEAVVEAVAGKSSQSKKVDGENDVKQDTKQPSREEQAELRNAIGHFQNYAKQHKLQLDNKPVPVFDFMPERFKDEFKLNLPASEAELVDLMAKHGVKGPNGQPANKEVIHTTVGEIVATMAATAITAPFKALAAGARAVLGQGSLTPAAAAATASKAQDLMNDLPKNASGLSAMQAAGNKANLAGLGSQAIEAVNNGDVNGFKVLQQDILNLTEAAELRGDESLKEGVEAFHKELKGLREDPALKEQLEDKLGEDGTKEMMKAMDTMLESIQKMIDRLVAFFSAGKTASETNDQSANQEQIVSRGPTLK